MYSSVNRILIMCACLCVGARLFAEIITLQTPNTQLVLRVEQGQDLQVLYYGDKSATIADLDAAAVQGAPALPAFGTVDMVVLPALQIQHADGDLSLELGVQNTEYRAQTDFDEATITLADKLQPVTVEVHYRAWHKVDIIETWTEIEHREKKPIVLKRFDSGTVTIPNGDNWLLHLHGDWAAEATPTVEPITRGVKIIRNTDGARNAHLDAPEVMISLDGAPKENHGRVLGAALCWSGNYEIRLSPFNFQLSTLYAGIDPQSSEYVLAPKTVFATPHLALTYSTDGMGGVSRAFHSWARTCGMLHNGNATRNILLNSWEGIYFDITEDRIVAMMDDIASFGGELFVMDDGWFGAKYPRNNDSSSLGDWVVDTRKLPNGLKGLIDQLPMTNDQRLKFGIWIEPEAVNTTSELYEKHPDWALQVKNRELKLGRGGTQLVLDMTNPQVQDFVFNLVDTLLTNYPEIAYIKWDANASMQNLGSLKANDQRPTTNLYSDYHLGLVKTLERIRTKYPNVTIQNCASGGGRANYGLMPYFDEFWVSDNNDALQRVYIQWGTSYFFPSNAMAQHIGGSPYLMTGRVTPIKFRCDVAMSGRLGMELQPAHMTDEERAQCTVAIADYKELREVIQLGNLYRLVSPYDRPAGPAEQQVASLMYVNDAKDHAVLFSYGLTSFMKQASRRIRLAGLDPKRTYTLTERNIRVGEQPCVLHGKSFTGAYLMSVGLDVPLSTEYSHDYPSRIFELK